MKAAHVIAAALVAVAAGFLLPADARHGRGGPSSSSAPLVPNLAALPTSSAPNTVAYAALNVPAKTACSAFSDPVTGVRTVKLTDTSTPTSGSHAHLYSTQGLQISMAWGTNQYTIMVLALPSGTPWLVDYTLGGGCTNWRQPAWTFSAGSGASGMVAFSRVQPRIIFVHTGTQLRMYNTQTNAFADTGVFPISWTGPNAWLMVNHDDTWATANNSFTNGGSAGTLYAANLTTGATQSQAATYVDDMYGGYGNVSSADGPSAANGVNHNWNLTTPTYVTWANLPAGYSTPSHLPSMNGYWPVLDTNTGGGTMAMVRVAEDGSVSSAVFAPFYYGQWHMSNQWFAQASGTQYFLMSMYNAPQGGWTAAMQYALIYVNPVSADTRYLGASYSVAPPTHGADSYWSLPMATESTDGKIVMFNSDMFDTVNGDSQVFLIEPPLH